MSEVDVPGLISQFIPLLRILAQMGCYNPQLKRFLRFTHLLVAFREHVPPLHGTRLNPYDLEHGVSSRKELSVDVKLVPFA